MIELLRSPRLVQREARAPERVTAATTTLIVLAWATAILPRLTQTLTAPKYRTTISGEGIPYSTIALLLDRALLLVLLMYCLLVFTQVALAHPRRLPFGVAVFLTPWALMVVRNLYLGDRPGVENLAYPLIAAAVWMLRPAISELRILGVLTGVTALISIALGVLTPERALYRSAAGDLIVPDKQVIPWGILVGPLTHGNSLGQFLVLGLPAILLVSHRLLRHGLLAVTVFALLWTSSRSALIALGVAATLTLLVSASRPVHRGVVAGSALLAGGLLVAALPLLTRDPLAFTNRGFIWSYGLEAWTESWLAGFGSGWYRDVGQLQTPLTGSVHHGHNQFLHALTTGGLLAVLAFALLFALAMVRAVRAAAGGSPVPAIYLAALFTVSLVEVPVAVVGSSLFLPVSVLPLALILLGAPPGDRDEPAGRTSRAVRSHDLLQLSR